MKLRVIATLAAALVVGCDGTTPTDSSPTPPQVPVAAVNVTLSPSSAMASGSAQATATLTSSSGTTLTGRAVSWSSSNSSVASVSSTGGVSAIKDGTATITATSEGVSGGAPFTVTTAVASVTVTLGSPSLTQGATTTALATVADIAGTPLPGRTVNWSSSNLAIATVSVSGQVLAVSPGTTDITATSEGISGSAALTVTPPPPPSPQWVLYPGNPVLAPSSGNWASGMVAGPMVVMFRDTLRMWFQGSSSPQLEGVVHIGYAWSMDGVSWHKSSAPVLSAGDLGWDTPNLIAPSVLVDGDTLRMWYGGGNVRGSGMRIGYAVSVDGVNWDRYTDPVMSGDQMWDSDGVLPGGVLKEGGVFKMWFSGGIGPAGYPRLDSEWSIGFATSSDGIHWTANANPVILHGEESSDYDRNLALVGTVRQTASGYELWYAGSRKEGSSSEASIAHATSNDGIVWVKQGVVLTSDGTTSKIGDAFYAPHVLLNAGLLQMWFAAWHPGPTIAYATFVE